MLVVVAGDPFGCRGIDSGYAHLMHGRLVCSLSSILAEFCISLLVYLRLHKVIHLGLERIQVGLLGSFFRRN